MGLCVLKSENLYLNINKKWLNNGLIHKHFRRLIFGFMHCTQSSDTSLAFVYFLHLLFYLFILSAQTEMYQLGRFSILNISIYKERVSWPIVVEGNLKAPFSIDTTPRNSAS